MEQNRPVHHALLAYLRHELCTPINGMMGYSQLLLETLQTQQETTWFEDLQKIYGCSEHLLKLVTVTLDPTQLEMSQIEGDLTEFGATLRMELLTPLSTVIGYCEMLLEEAPPELIPDLDKLNTSAQQLLGLVNDIINLAAQQLQTLNAQANSAPNLFLESSTASTLAQSAATTLRSLTQDSSEHQPQNGLILVIDDNMTNCDLLARQLRRHAYKVTTATNAKQALRLLKAIPYDLILLDVVMPGLSGLELLQHLKQHETWRHIPVIMISALDEIEGAVRCIELGAEDYLHKPFDPILLRTRIRAYLERKQLRDQEILYRQQVARLTSAAAAVETKTFNSDSLNDLIHQEDELGQLARVFQRMAQEVHSRECALEQQLHLLQVSVDETQKRRIVAEIATTDHFRQLQKRTQGSVDMEDLYQSSSYPPLSRSPIESLNTTEREYFTVKRPQQPEIVPDAENSTQTIAVHSYRGGTGKSNLTSNLAISIAKQGHRVGIIDTDLQSPGIHVLFGLDHDTIDRTLNDYLWGNCRLYEAAYDLSHILQNQSSNRTPEGSIYLVPASSNTNDITRILREGYHQERLLDGFSEVSRDLQLDFLLIDTHPGLNEETLQALSACSLLIVTLRPDYQDYQGTSVILELAKMLSVAEMLLVVNKVLLTFEVEPYRQQLEATYGVSVAEILPFSEEMMCLSSSEIFSVRYPDHPLTQAIDLIGQHIIEQRKTP
ncbi:response regulator [Leptolyngbya sp. NIES-2104]|uniref:response regulator n=1 Tax=Leptolyngbya sp. NIES-2104 TaxID=1552121 RepID=UPI0006EC90EE|nr:response regulator [Leptolyngbya sp. NIES-2104]GAP94294.1 cell division inhibitor [Leptolyngbya sp. NIES-2104]